MTTRVRFIPRRRRRLSLALIAGITTIVAAIPSPANAATQIGETFTPTDNCSPRTRIQSSSPGGQYAAPFAGVITSWSFQASSAGGGSPLRLKVARPAGGDNFTIVGESEFRAIPDSDAFLSFPVRISVQAGDVIGVYAAPASVFLCRRTVTGYGIHESAFGQDTPLGVPTTFTPLGSQQLDVSALLEPDCDSDGFGDESQDPDTSSCNPPLPTKADGTLTIDANKGKVEKGRKVTLTGQLDVAANESCEPNRQIQIQRRKKSQPDSAFATFETVSTDATGNFSTKEKVKKTYFYRAVVAETETCDDESSNSQKVRVQKKKAAQEA